MRELSIAFSSCPNDTFIFYALINGKLEHFPFKLKPYIADIEELNSLALKKEFDITKISFNALNLVDEDYILLDSGAALGDNCGPLLISKNFNKIEDLKNKKIGIPGKYTTANFLFDLFNSVNVKKEYLRFDEIIPAIISGKIDAGVIIHESRFTYGNFSLNKIFDLGELWQELSGSFIPLGGIAVKKSINIDEIKILDKYLKKSIKYAYNNFNEVKSFIKKYSQELDDNVIESHINLYVNKYTYSLGEEGIKALNIFYNKGMDKKIFKKSSLKICGTNGCSNIG